MRNIFAFICVTSSFLAVTFSLVEDILPHLHRCNCERRRRVCYSSAVESFKPFLTDGIPEWSIPKYEPYEPGRNYKLLLTDSLNTLMLTNISMSGLTRFEVINLRVRGGLPEVNFEARFPRVHLSAVGYRNINNLESPITGKGYKIDHEFNNFTVKFDVNGYTMDYTTDEGVAECFYLSNIRLKWQIQDAESHINYFNLGSNTKVQSTHIPYESGVSVLTSKKRFIQTAILGDISQNLCNSLNIMLRKMPINMLCLP